MKKGDIVLIPFPFNDLSGNINRPTVVLIESDEDVTVCFITTQFKWRGEFDIVLQPSESNGLKTISLLKLNKFASIDKDLIIGRLGTLNQNQVKSLNINLAKTFKIN